MRCSYCKVEILDDVKVCPLCQMALKNDDKKTWEQYVGYPDMVEKHRKRRMIIKIFLYVAILIEAVLAGINYLTYESISFLWSGIVGICFLYVFFTVGNLVRHKKGHVQAIYIQIPAVMAFLLALDYTMGWSGWSLEYGLPLVLLGLLALIIVCMCINHKNWQIYMILQLFTLIFSIVDLWLALSGIVRYQILPWITLGISAALFLGTVLIGDRKAMNELKRKFHV